MKGEQIMIERNVKKEQEQSLQIPRPLRARKFMT